jgi:hypothetical protein
MDYKELTGLSEAELRFVISEAERQLKLMHSNRISMTQMRNLIKWVYDANHRADLALIDRVNQELAPLGIHVVALNSSDGVCYFEKNK